MILQMPNTPIGRNQPTPSSDPPPDDPATPADERGTPANDLEAVALQSLRVAIGAVVAGAAVGAQLVRHTLGEDRDPGGEPGQPPLPALVVGATLGLAVETITRATTAAMRTVGTLAPWGSWVFAASGAQRATQRSMTRFNARWQDLAPHAEEAAAAFMREIVPAVAQAVLDRIDLTALIEERVDVESLVRGVDLDAVVARVDVDRIVERVDLDRIVDRVDIERIVARLDLDALVARVDPDPVVAKVDIDAVIRRVELTRLAREVIEELDLPALIRESTEGVTTEAVHDLRYGAVDADRAVARVVDRILGRRNHRAPHEPEVGDDVGAGP